MPKPQRGKQLHPLCHEHHMEMSRTDVLIKTKGPPTQTSAYACPVPDCAVHYTVSNGYFIAGNNGQVERDMTPHVICPRDGRRMYLAETNPAKRTFRLWRCPQCDSTRTNEEDLVNETPLIGGRRGKIQRPHRSSSSGA
jgi:hypothetical protein